MKFRVFSMVYLIVFVLYALPSLIIYLSFEVLLFSPPDFVSRIFLSAYCDALSFLFRRAQIIFKALFLLFAFPFGTINSAVVSIINIALIRGETLNQKRLFAIIVALSAFSALLSLPVSEVMRAFTEG